MELKGSVPVGPVFSRNGVHPVGYLELLRPLEQVQRPVLIGFLSMVEDPTSNV